MEKQEQPEKQKPTDREKLADKVLDIFSDSPEDMSSLVDLLKKLENNPILHPEKGEVDDKVEKKKEENKENK